MGGSLSNLSKSSESWKQLEKSLFNFRRMVRMVKYTFCLRDPDLQRHHILLAKQSFNHEFNSFSFPLDRSVCQLLLPAIANIAKTYKHSSDDVKLKQKNKFHMNKKLKSKTSTCKNR